MNDIRYPIVKWKNRVDRYQANFEKNDTPKPKKLCILKFVPKGFKIKLDLHTLSNSWDISFS